jgi:hypothetical protein
MSLGYHALRPVSCRALLPGMTIVDRSDAERRHKTAILCTVHVAWNGRLYIPHHQNVVDPLSMRIYSSTTCVLINLSLLLRLQNNPSIVSISPPRLETESSKRRINLKNCLPSPSLWPSQSQAISDLWSRLSIIRDVWLLRIVAALLLHPLRKSIPSIITRALERLGLRTIPTIAFG